MWRNMIRLIAVLFALAACAPVPTDAPPVGAPSTGVTRSAASPNASYERAVTRIEPVSERLCRRRNPDFPAIGCDFQFILSDDERLGQNAFQTIAENGRPQVIFTQSLLNVLLNEDEVAFILAHETAHQIARHIMRQRGREQLGASILGGLVAATGEATADDLRTAAGIGAFLAGRTYSKNFEIEADKLATVISHRAGYDPVKGAAPFARWETGSRMILSTHPPSSERLNAVMETARRIGAL